MSVPCGGLEFELDAVLPEGFVHPFQDGSHGLPLLPDGLEAAFDFDFLKGDVVGDIFPHLHFVLPFEGVEDRDSSHGLVGDGGTLYTDVPVGPVGLVRDEEFEKFVFAQGSGCEILQHDEYSLGLGTTVLGSGASTVTRIYCSKRAAPSLTKRLLSSVSWAYNFPSHSTVSV